MAARVEVSELVNPVQDIGDQLLEEHPRRDPDLPAQRPGHRVGELPDVAVVDGLHDAIRLIGPGRVQVAHLRAQGQQRVPVEAGQPDLHRPRVVEPRVGGEVGGQPLRERRQPRHPAGPVVERRRPGDDQEQPGVAPGVDLVQELPQGVERLVPDVTADPLQGLHLIQHQQQPGVARVAEHFEQPLQEPHRAEVVELAPDPGAPLGRGRDVRLAAQPGRERVGPGAVAGHHRRPVGPQRLGEGGRAHRDRGKPPFQQRVHRLVQRILPASGQPGVGGGGVGLQGEQPGVEHRAQRARRERRRPQRLAHPPVDGLQLVQRRLGLGDLHLGRGEPAPQRALGQVPGEERLAGAVLPAHRLERRAAPGHGIQVRVQGRGEPLQPHRQQVKTMRRNGPASQRAYHLTPAPGGNLVVHARTPNCSRSSASSRTTVLPSASTRSTG